jgi:hypothetical protein
VFINYFFEGGCNGEIVGPCGFRGMAGAPSGEDTGAAERAAMIRAALQVMIEREEDAGRRQQLQEMLDAIP